MREPAPPITVATIDDHQVVRQGIRAQLEHRAPAVTMVAEASTVASYLAGEIHADVVLLDLALEDGSSIDDIPHLVQAGAVVLVFTSEQRPVPLRRAVAAGASGVLLKSDSLENLTDIIHAAARGEFCCSGPLAHALVTDRSGVVELSDQQRTVLECLAEGLDYRATARTMGIAEGTVRTHLRRTREKFEAAGLTGNSHFITRHATVQGHLS